MVPVGETVPSQQQTQLSLAPASRLASRPLAPRFDATTFEREFSTGTSESPPYKDMPMELCVAPTMRVSGGAPLE
jgi:hypothetical protein